MKKLQQVKTALLTVTDDTYHFAAPNNSEDYIVYSENSEGGSVEADNYKLEQSVSGLIYFYTKKENHPFVDEIQQALINSRISFYLISVEYDSQTELIEYCWSFEV
ncbi:MAG: hypothetical protein ACLUFN_07540 [Eubacterium sp.]